MSNRAVVLVSGGLDSATTLAIACDRGFDCHALIFDYGQRHAAEIHAATRIADVLGATTRKTFILDLTQMGGSALTDPGIDVPHDGGTDIPVTYVPARNTVFLAVALGYAETLQAHDIFIGVNAVDYSGYPDCRPEYIAAFEKTANLATRDGVQGRSFSIHTPLIKWSKARIILAGSQLGIDYSITVSCYQADTAGRACGACDSCRIRKQGFIDAGLPDATRYQDPG